MMGSTLVCSPTSEEISHRLEYLIHPSHLLILKMAMVYLEEPMILPLLIRCPMSHLHPCQHRPLCPSLVVASFSLLLPG